jgi:hypothetical protein
MSDMIGVPYLDGGPVEKLDVLVSFFEPLDVRFLPPQDFFLNFSFLQLLSECFFFLFEGFG